MNWVASRKETRDRTVSQQRAVQSPCERCCCGATVCPNRLLPGVDGIVRCRRPRKTGAVWPRLAAMDRPMRWLYNWRFGSWLALAALALQLVVSFGHVHLDGVHRTYPFWRSTAREPRRRSCRRRTPATMRTTIIARSAPRSISPRTLFCRRRRNCQCRRCRERSSISLASPSISSRRGGRHFNRAPRRSPDRLLLIFGIAALVSFLRRRCSQD